MQAVILAAGQSSRFYPFTSIVHKAFITMMGKTLLEHTLVSLKNAGIEDIVIVVGKDNTIKQMVGNGKNLGIRITYVLQQEALGMGDALLKTEEHIKEDFFLLHAYHLEAEEFVADMMQQKKKAEEIVLLGKGLTGTDRYGYMQVTNDRVTHIVEKPDKILSNSLHVIGIYLLNKHFLAALKKTPLSQYHFEEALDTYAKTGNITYVKTDNRTTTLKYAWDLLDIKDYLLKDIKHFISPKAEISKHAIILGNVVVEEGAKIMEGACIKGPCYIGKNVVVGNNALVRNGSVIEESAVIGSFMEVKNSFIMHGVTTHAGFIGDSVIGSNCKIGTAICTTNVRLDRKVIMPEVKNQRVSSYRNHLGAIIGDNVVLGARVTTMPGIIIGNDSFIGPSTVVMENLIENMKLYTEFKNEKKENK